MPNDLESSSISSESITALGFFSLFKYGCGTVTDRGILSLRIESMIQFQASIINKLLEFKFENSHSVDTSKFFLG